jgi:hypothetical protein
MINLSFKTTLEVESRPERERYDGPRLRSLRKITELVLAGLILGLISHIR